MRRVIAVALVSLAAVFASPAVAGVRVGDAAPEMQGKDFLNSQAFTLKDMRGRVLIYDIFRTW